MSKGREEDHIKIFMTVRSLVPEIWVVALMQLLAHTGTKLAHLLHKKRALFFGFSFSFSLK